MGQGRNAVFLATQRWNVTGFDPSDEAVRIARQSAERLGINLKAVIARDDQFAFGTEQWDLIVMTFVRTPTKDDADKFWQALKPGGLVVYEDGPTTITRSWMFFVDFESASLKTWTIKETGIPRLLIATSGWSLRSPRNYRSSLTAQRLPCSDQIGVDSEGGQVANGKSGMRPLTKLIQPFRTDSPVIGDGPAELAHVQLRLVPAHRRPVAFGAARPGSNASRRGSQRAKSPGCHS